MARRLTRRSEYLISVSLATLAHRPWFPHTKRAICSLLRPAVVVAAYQSRVGKMEQMAFAAEGAAQHQFGPFRIHQIVPSVANSRIDSFPRRHADERQHPDLRLFGHISYVALRRAGFQ
jgi:hypothetical protein